MNARLGEENGWTLVELLAVLMISTMVLGATLSIFAQFERDQRINQLQNESQDRTRQAMTGLARELRNLASPSTSSPQAVDVAEPHELIFQTVDATKPDGSQNDRNIKRVRYCLSASSAGKATLWSQSQTWVAPSTPAVPARASCPDSGWPTPAGETTNHRAVAEDIVNREKDAPIFLYDSADPKAISSIRSELFVDANPGKSPIETKLASGVFLRNQNRAANPSFDARDTGTGHRVVLNGSASEDPEGNTLTHLWSVAGQGEIGTGAVLYWTAPAPGTYEITLTVVDAGGRDAKVSRQVPVS